MSDIPEDRLERFQPFTYCGLDHFGPCMIKDGCKELKPYAVLFMQVHVLKSHRARNH